MPGADSGHVIVPEALRRVEGDVVGVGHLAVVGVEDEMIMALCIIQCLRREERGGCAVAGGNRCWGLPAAWVGGFTTSKGVDGGSQGWGTSGHKRTPPRRASPGRTRASVLSNQRACEFVAMARVSSLLSLCLLLLAMLLGTAHGQARAAPPPPC